MRTAQGDDPAAHGVADRDPNAHGDGYDSERVHHTNGDPDGNQDRLVHHADDPAAGPPHHAVRPPDLDPV